MKRMKKIMMMALMVLVAVAAQAKDDKVTVISGDASTLKDGEKTAVIEFDYTKTVAEGTPLKQYLKDRGDDHVADWPEIAKTARDRFVKMFNKKNKKGVQIALAWASLAQRFPASSVLAREGAGCGSVGDVPGAGLASAPLSPSLWT